MEEVNRGRETRGVNRSVSAVGIRKVGRSEGPAEGLVYIGSDPRLIIYWGQGRLGIVLIPMSPIFNCTPELTLPRGL